MDGFVSGEHASTHQAFFESPRDESIISSTRRTAHTTTSDLSVKPMIFDIGTEMNEFLDLDTVMLSGQVSIRQIKTNLTEGEITKTTSLMLCNYFPAALFKSIDIFCDQKKISDTSDLYHYKAYIETLLSADYGYKSHNLQNALWYDDAPGHQETADIQINPGGFYRQSLARQGVFDFTIPIHADLFRCTKYFPDMMWLQLRLNRNIDSLPLIYTPTDDVASYEISFLKCEVLVTRIRLKDKYYTEYKKLYDRKGQITLPISRSVLQMHTLNRQSKEVRIHACINGQKPVKSFVMLVAPERYNGAAQVSPFKFQHFNLEAAHMYCDGLQIPSIPYTFDMTKGLFTQAYQGLMDTLGINVMGHDIGISKAKYEKDCFILGFDFYSDATLGIMTHPKESGVADLYLRFSSTQASGVVQLIIYNLYENNIFITQERKLSYDFN